MPSVPQRYEEIASRAMYLDWSSLVAARGPITREDMLMSKTWMPRINATVFDVGVPVEAPDICAYTVVQMDVLADIARRLDRPEEARAWTGKADLLTKRMIAKLWDGDRFLDKTTYSGESNPKSHHFMPVTPIELGQRFPPRSAPSSWPRCAASS